MGYIMPVPYSVITPYLGRTRELKSPVNSRVESLRKTNPYPAYREADREEYRKFTRYFGQVIDIKV